MSECYEHDAQCEPEDLTDVNFRGLRGCLACSGVFKADGKTGVPVDSKLFDEDHPINNPPEEG